MSSAKKKEQPKYVIAIDGPAGSGKSTVANLLAQALGYDYVDTGAMYRAITLAGFKHGVEANDAPRMTKLAELCSIDFKRAGDASEHVFLDGADITDSIRMPNVTGKVSAVSSHPGVREALVRRQREMAAAAPKGTVVEGRDVGTVVFPDAFMKIYLIASIEERAKRRQRDMAGRGVEVDLQELENLIAIRDEKDSSREISPLAKAEDAVTVDSTNMSIPETVEHLMSLVEMKIKKESG